jgi:hypothetical protein
MYARKSTTMFQGSGYTRLKKAKDFVTQFDTRAFCFFIGFLSAEGFLFYVSRSIKAAVSLNEGKIIRGFLPG